MLFWIKKIVPKPIFKIYHYTLAQAARLFYNSPSEKLIVIGVTGTSGKSTVVYLITKILERAGFRVGCSSTVMFKVGKKEWLNDKKMTMVGRFALQKLLKQMVKENCQYAVIETTSQGIEQYRHTGINYDTVVFTNLYPEHIQAHGSFENYKKAKLKLFAKLEDEDSKKFAGLPVKKTIIANLDDEHAKDFLNNWADEKIGFTLESKKNDEVKVIDVLNSSTSAEGIEFYVQDQKFSVNRFGRHNIYNCAAAIAVGLTQDLSLESMAANLKTLPQMPGNFELIQEGQNFKVIVDYAFEPKAVESLYGIVKNISHNNIIHVLGSTGGGRDKARRPILGKLAGENADYVIVANEDPYDEDPAEIIEQVLAGAKSAGKKLNVNLFKYLDRRQAIAKALSLANENDLVLITGKGSEQAIVVKKNKKIPWDDRTVVREELKKKVSS